MALGLKESIFQRLSQGKFSPTFQEIYGTLMAEVWTTFDLLIKPKIKVGVPREEVDAMVHDKIIQPIMSKIDNCGTENDITATTVRGMIYYLTGNCYIRWD
ncbi:MAG: hypothetical protein HQL35_09225 [Alphaproteobacteria bacterium]|nr:hypothetical protein [Alphaproteobacteria bacterium]